MFPTFRAMAPHASQAEDRDLSGVTLDSSPAAPGLLMRHPSPPPISPLSMMPAQQKIPMDILPGHSLPDRKQDDTDASLLGPARASDATSVPHHGSFLLDGASDDHLPPPLEGAYARASPLPSVETTLFSSKSHRTQRTPTPSENHTGMGSIVSSPPKSSKNVAEILQPRGSPLPSTQLVQFTSEAQPAQQSPTQSENHVVLEPKSRNTSLHSEMTTKKSRETALHPPRSRRVSTSSGVPNVQPQQSVPAKTDDSPISTSSKAPPSKRKRGEYSTETETKSAKKHRSQPRKEEVSPATDKPGDITKDKASKAGGTSKKEGGHTGSVTQQGAAKDEAPKQRGRPKKEEGSTGSVNQQAVVNDGAPKKRGRPKKEEGPPHSVKSQRVSKEDTPGKRGRPKKEVGPQQSVKSQRVSKDHTPAKRGKPRKEIAPKTAKTKEPLEQNSAATETPKKRGRPAKEAEPAQAVQSASVPTVDTPKKRGRPKKGIEAAQPTGTQIASPADIPRKKGRAKKNVDIAEATEPQGPSNVETTKKRGRSKATGQDETAKTGTPGKRGRPKKK